MIFGSNQIVISVAKFKIQKIVRKDNLDHEILFETIPVTPVVT